MLRIKVQKIAILTFQTDNNSLFFYFFSFFIPSASSGQAPKKKQKTYCLRSDALERFAISF